MRKLDQKSVKTHPSCWTAVEWMICQEAIQHKMRLSWVRVCVCVYGYVNAVRIMLCKLVNHNRRGSDMFAFNSKLVNEGESYGDLPTADVNKRAKSRKH